MEHPLFALMPSRSLSEAEQDELMQAIAVLQKMGWNRVRIGEAIQVAQEVARHFSRKSRPLVILCNDQLVPYVALRLPVETTTAEASAMSSELHSRLSLRELDQPGLSMSFWAVGEQARGLRRERLVRPA